LKIHRVKIDEELMRNIAKKTGGQYFRATDNTSLQAVYNEIDKLEKSEIKDKRYLNYIEKFPPFLWISFVLAVVEIILRRTVYRSII
jgi:Ca-activated chloride channel family protein